MNPQGLGDTIGNITSFLGIDKVADAVAKLAGLPGCGCEERKAYLNHLFPYNDYTRKFKVVKSFRIAQERYDEGAIIDVTKNSLIFGVLTHYVRDGFLQEL